LRAIGLEARKALRAIGLKARKSLRAWGDGKCALIRESRDERVEFRAPPLVRPQVLNGAAFLAR
jgi:hypothetical protein